MTTLLVINPNSRNGDTDCNQIVEALAPLGDVQIHQLSEGSGLGDHVDQLGSTLSRIVVAGGDGTLHYALPHVLRAGVPLGVIPMGTANDFARSMDLPTDFVAAAELIAQGSTRSVDVGVVNDRYFLNAVGIGLGPDLTRHMDKEKKKRLGVLAYLESLIHVVGRCRRRYATVQIDGQRKRSSFIQITIANGRHYGGGLLVCDKAKMDDGLLHVLCVRPLTPFQLMLRALRMKNGAVTDDDKLVHLKGSEVSIETIRCNEVTADGELITATPVQCRSLPRALQVYSASTATETAANNDTVIDRDVLAAPLAAIAS